MITNSRIVVGAPSGAGISTPYFRNRRSIVRNSPTYSHLSRTSLFVNQSDIWIDNFSIWEWLMSSMVYDPSTDLYINYARDRLHKERIRHCCRKIALASTIALIIAALIIGSSILPLTDDPILRPPACDSESVVAIEAGFYVCYLNQHVVRIHRIDKPSSQKTRCRVGATEYDAPGHMVVDYEARNIGEAHTSKPRRHEIHISRHMWVCVWAWLENERSLDDTPLYHESL